VVLLHNHRVVAEHRRSWEKEGVFFNYLHYLPLLERKPGSLDHARPLADLQLPSCFDVLRRRLEAEQKKSGDGIREFIRVLRLLEDYPMARLRHAVEKGLAIRAHHREAIAQFLIPPSTRRPRPDLLRQITVAKPDISAYQVLLSNKEVRHG
jgi:hypothetical protein